jgi:hypothetical protein
MRTGILARVHPWIPCPIPFTFLMHVHKQNHMFFFLVSGETMGLTSHPVMVCSSFI